MYYATYYLQCRWTLHSVSIGTGPPPSDTSSSESSVHVGSFFIPSRQKLLLYLPKNVLCIFFYCPMFNVSIRFVAARGWSHSCSEMTKNRNILQFPLILKRVFDIDIWTTDSSRAIGIIALPTIRTLSAKSRFADSSVLGRIRRPTTASALELRSTVKVQKEKAVHQSLTFIIDNVVQCW